MREKERKTRKDPREQMTLIQHKIGKEILLTQKFFSFFSKKAAQHLRKIDSDWQRVQAFFDTSFFSLSRLVFSHFIPFSSLAGTFWLILVLVFASLFFLRSFTSLFLFDNMGKIFQAIWECAGCTAAEHAGRNWKRWKQFSVFLFPMLPSLFPCLPLFLCYSDSVVSCNRVVM